VTVTAVEVGFDQDFWQSVAKMDASYNKRVVDALNLFVRNPRHPNLHLKPLKKDLDGLWSVRASRDVRILMEKRGDLYLWLFAGLRRDVYKRAERGRFMLNQGNGFMGFVDRDTPATERRVMKAGVAQNAGPGILDHWSTPELLQVGLTDEEVDALRSLVDEYELLDLELADERLDFIIKLMEMTPESFGSHSDVVQSEDLFRKAIAEFGAAAGVSQLYSAEEIERLVSAPIEDWMVFLHPDQETIVRASYGGPARVRGAAGTGKTVVALHRAAELSIRHRDDGPVLFVTYAPSLTLILENLFTRLPRAGEGAGVDFRSVESLAVEFGKTLGFHPAPEADTDEAFTAAVSSVVSAGSPLDGLSSSYLRAEIEAVIRGRGFEEEADYLEASRRGRKVGFTEAMRRQAWELHLAWRTQLGEAGDEINDLILKVSREMETSPGPWRCAIVDEAQDLTMAGLELVRALSTNQSGRNREDGLLLCGDGAQKVRPGGYTLRQAGIEVRGRTTILRNNYRTTSEIVDAALAIAGAEEIVDLDESFRRGELKPESGRMGTRPKLLLAEENADQIDVIMGQVELMARRRDIGLGDIAVLVPTGALVDLLAGLGERDVKLQALGDYDGTSGEALKVGTWSEAKGLEFKAVIVVGCGESSFPSLGQADEWRDEREERRILELSHLFVAMTRARDELALVAFGDAAPEVAAASGLLYVEEA
jgi:mRNA-degrading endonuclease RelE of RelBE toxin-antitoxin system